METKAKHLEPYFYSAYTQDGVYDLPVIKKQQIDLSHLKLIRYSSTIAAETSDLDATVHFFEYDDRFDEIWRNPSSYIAKLVQYKQVMSPDFSMYTNIALALQVFNTFRSRWLGAFFQEHGLTVIPSVSWSDEWSYGFCFDAVEPGSVVAVSTVGCMDVKGGFMRGFEMMCRHIDPACVICYAKPFDEMRDFADIIEVPYMRNVRISEAISALED